MNPTTRPPWWLVALLVVMAFAFQGTRAIWEPDEGRYTAAGINMLQSGEYVVPTVDGEHPHLTKPPITYWLLAASFSLLGYDEWAARVPGALAYVGTGLLVFGLGRRFCPPRPWLPSVVWALSLAPVVGANVVSTDGLLVLFETAAMLAFVEAWQREGTSRRNWILAMWLAWGLAFMTKGPPGLLPLLAMIAFLVAHDRARLRGLFAPAGLVLFAIVALTWFGLIVRQEPGRLAYFLGYEVYDRVFTAAHDRNAQWYGGLEIYLPVFIVGALPWWVLAMVATGGPRAAWTRLCRRVARRDREGLLLLYWLLVPLAIFFVAKSRLELYVLPLFVPLAVLLARTLAGWSWLTPRRLAVTATITAVALIGIKLTAAHFPSDRDARAMAAAIEKIIDPHGIDEIVFVDMRGFHGLQLYLDVNIESVQVGEHALQHVRFVTEDELCAELAERENNVYAVKEELEAKFVTAATGCSGTRTKHIGEFDGDGHRIALYIVRPGQLTNGG